MKAVFTLQSIRTYRDRVEELSLRIQPPSPKHTERPFVAVMKKSSTHNEEHHYIKDVHILNRICKDIFTDIYATKTYGEYDPVEDKYTFENPLFATSHELRIIIKDLFTIEHLSSYCDLTITTTITGDMDDLRFLIDERIL